MKKISFIWNWLVYSSANAEHISLTVKSAGIAIIPTLLIIFNVFNIKFTSEQLTLVVDQIAQFIIVFGAIISFSGVTVGILRKITSTLDGTNSVVAKYSNKE